MELNRDGRVVVEAVGLTKVYGDGRAAEVRALDNVSFRICAAEFVAVMGPSGSGKSTLLNMIGALDRPTSGQVFVNGQDIGALRDLDGFRARTVGFVFQLHNLIPTLTAVENVEVPMRGQGLSERMQRKRAAELLAMVGLGDRLSHLPSQLSGGQRQKVAIARALANDPAIILADEPTGNLDSASGDELLSVFEQLHSQRGTTIIIVTHDAAVARRTHRILMMQDGRIVHEDIVGDAYSEDLKALARSELGRAVLGGAPLEILSAAEREMMNRMLARAVERSKVDAPVYDQ
ncbi:MAG TPA: ABC transporter ATP-binding protein [Anaerolineae bacterium]|nr:ABC transporter ATP-binding protein [Anaerolineae bacterium]